MSEAPLPSNESERLQALQCYAILDTEADRDFDDLAFLASTICRTPIAVVTLVDEQRQWFKAKIGLDATQTPRRDAFCAHTILRTELMVIEDARSDSRFADNPLVTGSPFIRFYAGAPLIDQEGHALGSLCVIDSQPRTLTATQRKALLALGRQTIALLELRKNRTQMAELLSRSV